MSSNAPRPASGITGLGRFVSQVLLRGNFFAKLFVERNLARPFWLFMGVSFLFDSGMFIFFLLYNLYLLDLGFREDFLGWITGAMAVGTIVGSLPAGWLAQRAGSRKALLVCLALVSTISVFRAEFTSAVWLILLSFAGGMAAALWAVLLPPIVAQLADEKNRSFAFSVIFASGIAFGIVAGLVGGFLPKFVLFISPHQEAAMAKRLALLFACSLTALAIWPASRLQLEPAPVPEKRRYPRNDFVYRFFPALAIWSFATGAFNPFFNAYFAHGLGVAVERIGTIVAGAQLMQVLAILAAPFVFQRFGTITGILYTQLACGLAMEWLASVHRGWLAAFAYTAFAGFQWMSEPGMYSCLMNNVHPGERAGAAAMNLLVISGTQAVSAALAGQAFARFGYPRVMMMIGALIVGAGFSFRFLMQGTESSTPIDPASSAETSQGSEA